MPRLLGRGGYIVYRNSFICRCLHATPGPSVSTNLWREGLALKVRSSSSTIFHEQELARAIRICHLHPISFDFFRALTRWGPSRPFCVVFLIILSRGASYCVSGRSHPKTELYLCGRLISRMVGCNRPKAWQGWGESWSF